MFADDALIALVAVLVPEKVPETLGNNVEMVAQDVRTMDWGYDTLQS